MSETRRAMQDFGPVTSQTGSGIFDVVTDEALARSRAEAETRARSRAAEIVEAVEALSNAKVIPRRRWQQMAHVLYAKHIYAAHIEPFTYDLTYSEMAARLNRIGIPRFRADADWSPQIISEIRKTVRALKDGEILLPVGR